jgi:hypothetical protein
VADETGLGPPPDPKAGAGFTGLFGRVVRPGRVGANLLNHHSPGRSSLTFRFSFAVLALPRFELALLAYPLLLRGLARLGVEPGQGGNQLELFWRSLDVSVHGRGCYVRYVCYVLYGVGNS